MIQTTVYIPDDIMKAIDAAAEKDQRSRSSFLVYYAYQKARELNSADKPE